MTDHEKHNQAAEAKIKQNVADYGWHVAQFRATSYLPSFAYTIGLWKNYQHPELICFGLMPETLHAILNIGGEMAKSGLLLKANEESRDFFEKGKSYFLEVHPDNLKDYFGYGIWFNQGPFPALQIVWGDRNHTLPWEEGFEEKFIYQQPLLDRNHLFKFREAPNAGVVTTKHFTDHGKPILYAEHDDEGQWLFLTEDEWDEGDAQLMRLDEVVKRDPSLNALFNLDYGEFAEREAVGGKWFRGKREE